MITAKRLQLLLALFVGFLFLFTELLQAQETAPVSSSNSPEQLLALGNSSYEKGDFHTALRAYIEATQAGADNGHVLYNIGNCYYRLRQFGRAILYYRRALLQLPRDPDIANNLALAKRSVNFATESETPPIFSLDRLASLRTWLSDYEIWVIALWGYAVFWIAVLIQGFRSTALTRSAVVLSLLLTLCWSALAAFSRIGPAGQPVFAIGSNHNRGAPAVVISKDVKVYAGDSTSFQVVFLLQEGVEVGVGEQRGDWIEVVVDNKRGWLQRSEIEII